MFDEIEDMLDVTEDALEGAIKLLNQGSDIHQAMAGRLRSIIDAECMPLDDLLPVLWDIRKGNLLQEDAILSLILDVTRYQSRVAAKELMGEPEDFEALCTNRCDDLVGKLKVTIKEFARSPLPPNWQIDSAINTVAKQIDSAISTVAERFDRSVINDEYEALFSKMHNRELLRLLAEVDSTDIAEMIDDEPEEFLKRKESGERLLTGRTNSERELDAFKANIERELLS